MEWRAESYREAGYEHLESAERVYASPKRDARLVLFLSGLAVECLLRSAATVDGHDPKHALTYWLRRSGYEFADPDVAFLAQFWRSEHRYLPERRFRAAIKELGVGSFRNQRLREDVIAYAGRRALRAANVVATRIRRERT